MLVRKFFPDFKISRVRYSKSYADISKIAAKWLIMSNVILITLVYSNFKYSLNWNDLFKKLYKTSFYNVEESSGKVDYNKLEETAIKEKPQLIICGASAYSQDWDYAKFRETADKVGALLMADIAHPAGLIAAKLLNDPSPHCHILTTTTHKTLRGPRGGGDNDG